MFSRYFRYSIGSTGRIHRYGEAIEALTVRSRVMLTNSSLLKNEKKKKKRNPEVIDREGDEDGDVKIKEKWFEN